MKRTLLVLLMALGVISNTHAQCADPTNLQATYSNNVTTFTWDTVSGATGYILELRQPWDPWAEYADSASTNSYTLTGIMHSLTIDWRIMAVCPSGVSGYTTTSFTVPCPLPSGMTATNVTMSGATVNWIAAPGYNTNISDFSVSYRKSGTTTWISAGNTSVTTKNITNLLANTTYEWRVRQTCPYSNSNYITSSFTTLGCTSAGNNSTEWINLFKVGSINRTSGAESGGYAQTGLNTNLAAGSNNSARIKVGNNGAFTTKKYRIYIDYNNNNVFEETESAYGPANITSTGNINFTLSIPSNAPNGSHKMRVIMARSNATITGCISGHLGETEDYTVNITGGSNKETPTVVSEFGEEEANINIYPNPVSDILNIDLPGTSSIIVYDLVGKRIHQQQASAGTTKINVAQWPAGQYIMQTINEEGQIEVLRFVKQ